MLPGFEIETRPLTEEEKKLLPRIIYGLSKRIGVESAISNRKICETLSKKGIEVTEVRIRKIINHIRMRNLVPGLLANGKGYYVSCDPVEVKKYIESLSGREKAIRGVRESTQKYLWEITTKHQSQLFTSSK